MNNSKYKSNTNSRIYAMTTNNKAGFKRHVLGDIELIEANAESGCITSQWTLGRFYLNGIGVLKDVVEAKKWLLLAAKAGDADAQYDLSLEVYYNTGLNGDYFEAFKWATASAEQGHIEASALLGRLYYEGHGVKKDLVESLYNTIYAAKHGQPMALFNLAYFFGEGVGVSKCYSTAFVLLELAIQGGAADPLNNYKWLKKNMKKSELALAKKYKSILIGLIEENKKAAL